MWRRLPTYFPNLRLQMLPLTAEQKALLGDTGWLREVAFRCEPKTTKVCACAAVCVLGASSSSACLVYLFSKCTQGVLVVCMLVCCHVRGWGWGLPMTWRFSA
jgi:hypothetical protein